MSVGIAQFAKSRSPGRSDRQESRSERLVLTISDSDQDSARNYLEAIRRALGGVDLDRASCAEANRVVFCYLGDLGVISWVCDPAESPFLRCSLSPWYSVLCHGK